MAESIGDRLRAAGATDVVDDARLADLTTLRVGGPVAALVTAGSDDDLAAVSRVATEHRIPWLVVGRGSNLLVADSGWPGIVVTLLGRGFRGVEFDGTRVRAGAAEPLPSLAVRVAAEGLGGFAWAAAVPGSLGGAVRMNAGAHGGEMSQSLVEVEVFRLRSGVREVWAASALGLRYRHSELPDDAVVVGAVLELSRADAGQLREEIKEIRQWRREHQPINEPNCGSVFTNPPGDSAGRLVDAVGGKALQVGGATISDRHANFIVTSPGASAQDVHDLLTEVRSRVHDSFGIDLHPEVVIVGPFGASPPRSESTEP